MARYLEAEKVQKAKENVLVKPENTLEGWPEVKGHNFDENLSLKQFIEGFMA